ncbi:MAG: arginine--tRNA ligase [Deltaproteobacteria bacterium]|jgi:arginyl-tRNA synthetase|nr:arginine--tRNA ligase [Deltaproteobacteria bacterium]
MIPQLTALITRALQKTAQGRGLDPAAFSRKFVVEIPANPERGHFSTNAAMIHARDFALAVPGLKGNPALLLARELVDALERPPDFFSAVEIAGPGFINFRLAKAAWQKLLQEIRARGDSYGKRPPTGQKILVEYVSSNPTGPLHVGHGRGAAWGDAFSRILEYLGHEVTREYYVNDAGNQIATLGKSILFRALHPDLSVPPPEGHYKGAYIKELADSFLQKRPRDFFAEPQAAAIMSEEAAQAILAEMRADLVAFGVEFDSWFSEKSLIASGELEKAVALLREKGLVYEKDGALFFESSALGDDKDRVLRKSDGSWTYFASDVAYHANKYARGFDRLIDVLGADHVGYLGRMRAVARALGRPDASLKIVLYQLVRLFRGGVPYKMSVRAGEFIPLKVVMDEVSPDAARFLYLTQSHDSTLDFDLELAKSQSAENPVYYVQYLCARAFQVRAKAQALFSLEGDIDFSLLSEPGELALIQKLSLFPEVVGASGDNFAPHFLTTWLMDAAKLFHRYYGETRLVLPDNPELTRARIALAMTVRAVVGTGLSLLGVSVPERMAKES